MISFGIVVILVGVIALHASAFLDGQDYANKSNSHQVEKLVTWFVGGVSLMIGIYIVASH